ncbi:tryptophan 2,3-dioxygenase [Bacillus suaedaesalsae]|uniref:Tryptophan 2,3-dioxygenase n=1 Tax=Bacillus suaedaesalsae TaxID=2810349 RepID=A0ABS2DEI9_9BACI|nr:tryptophan 2,3-dioxygenase [Bacillus suaedaesalsae]MBM6616863.1 tryptophan 2,3-dioxygenase [Bacillus suaedaesalsae]
MSQKRDEGLHTNFSKDMSYGDYLKLDSILDSQERLSNHHDEMMFIVIHQTSELWMKLILHEMVEAKKCIEKNDLEPAFKMLARVSRIQEQLIQSWDVLSTLTPSEYMEFRDQLGKSSGFQSHQNRMIEFLLGSKREEVLSVYKHEKEKYELLTNYLTSPSIYDTAIKALSMRGFSIDAECLQRDWSKEYQYNESVEKAWLAVYTDVKKHWDLYELAEKLVDIETRHQKWRYNHMLTVERIIGNKRGTGGSSGVEYLKRVLDHRFFPELWSIRTQL